MAVLVLLAQRQRLERADAGLGTASMNTMHKDLPLGHHNRVIPQQPTVEMAKERHRSTGQIPLVFGTQRLELVKLTLVTREIWNIPVGLRPCYELIQRVYPPKNHRSVV
jgi:hypothetical protein